MTENKNVIDCWPCILAKNSQNTTGWILRFCIASLAKNKKLGAWPPCTSCIKVCCYQFFLDFFKKRFLLCHISLCFFVYFSPLILHFRGVSFVSPLYMIPFFFTESGSGYLISYFSAIVEFEVHGGQITKIYHGLWCLMH